MPDEALPAPIPAADDGLPGFAREEVAAARHYRDAARAESTRRKYACDWRDFAAWCRERGHDSLPASPAVVAVYLSHEADRGCAPRPSTAAVWSTPSCAPSPATR